MTPPVGSLDSSGLPETPNAAGATSPLGGGDPLLAGLPPNATPQQEEAVAMQRYNSDPALQAYIKQTYGYIGAYLLAVPELLPILVAAGLGNWDQARFDGAVTQTSWWQGTSQSQRNFQQLQATDPGEANSQVAQMQDTILTTAQSLGVSVPQSQLHDMATFAVSMGWSADVITQTLRAGSVGQPSTAFGATATFADQAQQLAGEYIQPMSNAELQAYVKQNLAGTLTADGLQQQLADKAMIQYPWMAKSIQMGVTPSQYLSGYASAAGKTLEMDPSAINWSQPKYMQALLQPNAQGQQAPVSIGQFQQNLMKDPTFGYQYTSGARDQAYAAADQILTTFGRVK